MTRIAIEDLTYRYHGADEEVLRGLDLVIESGEAHALLGASGAGKTTLLNLLSGLLQPTRGRILFDRRDVSRVAPAARNISQVFQFPVLYDGLSVAENLAFPMRNRGFAESDVRARTACIADELALVDLLDKPSAGLSLFEKQLVCVGKSLMQPDIGVVLLDEPLTAVEPKRKWQLRQSLKKVQADLGVTMIYVTHDQTEALTFADRVTVLAEDGILQTASPQVIYNEPSHEFVGHFVGSPGMDFLSVARLERAPPELSAAHRVGVRPEWTEFTADGTGHVRGICGAPLVTGTTDGEPSGVVPVASTAGRVNVQFVGSVTAGAQVWVRFLRCVTFADQRRVKSIEFA